MNHDLCIDRKGRVYTCGDVMVMVRNQFFEGMTEEKKREKSEIITFLVSSLVEVVAIVVPSMPSQGSNASNTNFMLLHHIILFF